eukprot:CAMPEP_0172588054 /NCGR_PEP_ID=MMETSP1068-20121228/7012_1 /TAXON_ID=35684 /ORGANISM="Pseudopedinella elastica, Strain CCMP716" /LENGTH=53 /DNA_ID=CAMNT_0013383267 /DNA_START=527 /DNA_END=688 /DNA_ORIENTATION=-
MTSNTAYPQVIMGRSAAVAGGAGAEASQKIGQSTPRARSAAIVYTERKLASIE